MSKKLSRRDFARTSVAAGAAAAAVALPKALFGETASVATSAPEKIAEAATTTAAAKGASAARRRLVSLPPQGFAYGGDPASSVAEFRDSIVFANSVSMAAGQQKLPTDGTWAEGLTIPSEYYVDEKHFPNDERFVAENLWLMADHVNRIPKPGDYFVFEYGSGDSVIVLRDKAGEVKGFHNVCRHRGSRMCRHDDDPAPKDRAPLGQAARRRTATRLCSAARTTPGPTI